MSKKKILMLRWDGSAYDSLRHLQSLLAYEYTQCGFEIETVEVNAPGWNQKLIDVLRSQEVNFATGFSGVGAQINIETGVNIWEAFKTPFFNWNCDHICYNPKVHVVPCRWVLQGYVFPDHARFVTKNFSRETFAAHFGIPSFPASESEHKAGQNHNGRLIFAKSGASSNLRREGWRTKLPSLLYRILNDSIDKSLHGTVDDLYENLSDAARGQNLEMEPCSAIALFAIRELDMFVRAYRAELVLDSLKAYPMDVFGSGWEHIRWSSYTGARYCGSVKYGELMDILPRYLGAVSTNPNIQDSVHDRVTLSLAASVVPLSESNRYSREFLPLIEDYSFAMQPDSIKSAAEKVLSEPELALKRTRDQSQQHSKENGLSLIALKILDYVNLSQSLLQGRLG